MYDDLTLNIIAYSFMCLWGLLAASIRYWSPYVRVPLALITGWSVFMIYYLVTNHDEIISSPLNQYLNAIETVTNWLIAWLFMGMYFHGKKLYRKKEYIK